jgi:hypothetical protein
MSAPRRPQAVQMKQGFQEKPSASADHGLDMHPTAITKCLCMSLLKLGFVVLLTHSEKSHRLQKTGPSRCWPVV